MEFNKIIKEIKRYLNEKNYEEIKLRLFSSNKQICLFCLDALKTDLSLLNLHDLISLFKQKKSFDINNKILELLIESIDKNIELKKEVYIIQFIKYLQKNLKKFRVNKELLLNSMDLLNKFELLENDLIDEMLFHSDENIRIYTISLLKRDNQTFEKLLPLIKNSEDIRCEILKKIPKEINLQSFNVLMENMVNGTPKIRHTIINSLSDLDEISDLYIPLLKYALTVDYLRSFTIKLINKVKNTDTSEIFINEFNKLNKDKNNRNFDTNYYTSLIEAISNSNNIDLFPLISNVFNGYFSPCFQYVMDYILNVANELNEDNLVEIFEFIKLHKDLIINKDFLLQKLIKFLKKIRHEDSIIFLLEISSEVRKNKLQNEIFDLLKYLSVKTQKEIFETLDINLYNFQIQNRLETYKNNLKYKKMNEFF